MKASANTARTPNRLTDYAVTGQSVAMKSTREAFGVALLELAESGLDLAVVSADTHKSMGVTPLKESHPERCLDCGIAEQDMLMVAAGLATTGKTVFAVSYSTFTSMRSLEQLRSFVCYPGLNVKVVGGLGGFSAGIEGVTHIALEDLGIVRCIPELLVVNPADYTSTIEVVKVLAHDPRPAYIRLGRDPTPALFETYSFSIGKGTLLHDNGADLGIITSGIILGHVLPAVRALEASTGAGVRVLEVPTIKPIDEHAVVDMARSTSRLVTVEEHNQTGGLWSAVCEVLCTHFPKEVISISAPDEFTQCGQPDELLEHYGLNAAHLEKRFRELLG